MAASDFGSVWVVIPAYNEETAIPAVVGSLRSAGYSLICVVDDGSQDRTGDAARLAGSYVLRHLINLGQGAALQTGIDYALRSGADYICTFDADGQHAVESLAALLEALVSKGADAALGSRFLGPTSDIPRGRKLLLKAALAFTRMHSGLQVSDTHNGLRAFTRHAAELLTIEQPRMAHASEILQKLKANHLSYCEVPVTVKYSPYSKAKGQSGFDSVKILIDLLYHSIASKP